MMDLADRLSLALVATRYSGGPATAARGVRNDGIDYLQSKQAAMDSSQRAHLEVEVSELVGAGVDATLLTTGTYPPSLAAARRSPAALFVMGPLDLLQAPSVGVCGSRNASDEGLRAARSCADSAARLGFSVVSGYARGVDMAAHTAALVAGGRTVIVLPEGILRFRIKRGEFERAWDPGRVVVVSQFSPLQAWSTGSAMTRNGVISGLSATLIVVEATETGGTLAAGLHGLERGQKVIALSMDAVASGNEILRSRGAVSVRSRRELDRVLGDLQGLSQSQLTLL